MPPKIAGFRLASALRTLAELEVRALHQKIDLLLEEQIKLLFESQQKQLDILNKIEKKIDQK